MEPTMIVEPNALRYQPLKALFLLYTVCRILVYVPWWSFKYTFFPSLRPRRSWSISRAVANKFTQLVVHALFSTGSFAALTPNAAQFEKDAKSGFLWIHPKDYVVIEDWEEAARINGVKPERVAGFWYGKRDTKGVVGQPAGEGEKVVYHIHGGGFISGSASPKGAAAANCADMISHFSHLGITRAFQVDWRKSTGNPLPPKDPFPAALIDVLAGYDYLVNDLHFQPQDILVSGDSSGGNMIIALTRAIIKLKQSKNASLIGNLDIPRALLIVSPAIDWGRSGFGPSSSIYTNWHSDFIHPFLGVYPVRAYLGNLPLSGASLNSWVSPASLRLPEDEVDGMFKGFPNTYVMVGGAEVSVDEARVLRDRLVHDIGEEKVQYLEVVDGTHVCMFSPMGVSKAEKEWLYAELVSWLEKVF